MKRLLAIALMVVATNSNAFWGGLNSNEPWDENDWPVWSPMFWMEEMSDELDDNKWNRYGAGYHPYGYVPPLPYYRQPYPYYYQPVYPQPNAETNK